MGGPGGVVGGHGIHRGQGRWDGLEGVRGVGGMEKKWVGGFCGCGVAVICTTPRDGGAVLEPGSTAAAREVRATIAKLQQRDDGKS